MSEPKATRDECRALARRVYGEDAHVAARQSFTTWWVVEVFEGNNIVLSREHAQLAKAYGAVAVHLRAHRDRREVAIGEYSRHDTLPLPPSRRRDGGT